MEDLAKAQNAGRVFLGLSGGMIVVLVLQWFRIVPLLYVSMVIIGVIGAMLTLAMVAGEWLLIVSSIGCFISLQRMKTIARMLQDR